MQNKSHFSLELWLAEAVLKLLRLSTNTVPACKTCFHRFENNRAQNAKQQQHNPTLQSVAMVDVLKPEKREKKKTRERIEKWSRCYQDGLNVKWTGDSLLPNAVPDTKNVKICCFISPDQRQQSEQMCFILLTIRPCLHISPDLFLLTRTFLLQVLWATPRP